MSTLWSHVELVGLPNGFLYKYREILKKGSDQLFITLYTLYIYSSALKHLRRHLPNPFENSPVLQGAM